MKIQFDANQDYQLKAIKSVVDVFEGQQLGVGDFEFAISNNKGFDFGMQGTGNKLALSKEIMLGNVEKIQKENSIEAGIKKIGGGLGVGMLGSGMIGVGADGSLDMNFSVEMETATGKTYVYLRTIFELNKKYGFKKFIIVVPSIAIREGVLKNLEITRDHFSGIYGNVPLDYYVYDSKKVGRLRNFASSNSLQILVINIDAFNKKDIAVIHKENDRLSGRKPIEFIKEANPIVIMDEPQNMESERAKEAIAELNPLCTLRYSATHRNYYNLLYRLSPVDAYDKGLVKRIEVDSVREENSFNDVYILVKSITPAKKFIKASIEIEVSTKDGVKKKDITVSTQIGKTFDLCELSGGREQYEGFVVNGIDADSAVVSFANGESVSLGEKRGEMEESIMKMQIEETIREHLEKEKKLKGKGIKVLSLFFVDKVANYRDYEQKDLKGKFALWFEQLYEEFSKKSEYKELDFPSVSKVHDGYFSQDKKGRIKDTKGDGELDQDTYDLIMKDKERLLSLEEPLKFIFSHSALREGWDNPNVFQICTLNESKSEIKKRQEIGRGLRLPVNQDGQRIFDKSLNILTVIANESYNSFAKKLQLEIETETGVSFEGRIKNKNKRKTLKLKKNWKMDENFIQLWNRIKQKTRYQVGINAEELVIKAGLAIAGMPQVLMPTIRAEKAAIEFNKSGVDVRIKRSKEKNIRDLASVSVPDILGYLSAQTNLTRKTILDILNESKRIEDILKNPQQFLDLALIAINKVMQDLMVDGIRYEKIKGKEFEMTLFQSEEIESYIERMIKIQEQDKTLYDYVVYDSEVEERFAKDLESKENVKFYMKLPGWFKIETPIGTYNPDWAIVFENDSKVYFVAETKDTTDISHLREEERQKIKCGIKHFEQLEGVEFAGPIEKLTDINI